MSAEIRTPDGDLVGRGRSNVQKNLLHLRDSLISIKRYIYRRIMERAFEPLSSDYDLSKDDLRRFSAWLQPTLVGCHHSNTEVHCFNSRLMKNHQGIGTPAVLFPTSSRGREQFYKPSFEGLKNRVFVERRIPVALLELLSGKSFKKHRDSAGCLNLRKIGAQDPRTLHRRLFETCGTHGTVAIFRSQTGFVTHYGNGARLWPLLTNRFSVLTSCEVLGTNLEK